VVPWDRDAVHQVFDGLEFRVLRDRLFATLSADEPQAEGGIELDGSAWPPARSGRGSTGTPRRGC
jgi:DNA polymerase-1